MDFKHSNKIKVVWICHFSNAEVQEYLPIWRSHKEFATWVPNMLKGFENCNEIDLYVISPHEYLKKRTHFVLRNINYYFLPFGMPIWHKHWFSFFRIDIYTHYYFFIRKVLKIVEELNPTLINLIGTEMQYYSPSILKVPFPVNRVLITIQGFISQVEFERLNKIIKSRIRFEINILKSFKYFCGEQDSSTYIKHYNPNHKFFRLYFPINEELAEETLLQEKLYDCIYFGRLSKTKGTEDFIKIIAELSKFKPDIKACIVGGGDVAYWTSFAKKLNCEVNIVFTGFVETQKELFKYVKASRVFLAPPYKERLSSTIREAMLLKVPIVAYATGGIPYINEFDENIFMVKTGEYKLMAEKTLLLLRNEKLASDLADKAYQYAKNEYSLEVNMKRLLDAYHTILNESKK